VRTKDFVERVSELGYKVSVGANVTQVLVKTGWASLNKVAVISEKECNKVNLAFTGVGANDKAFNLIMKYANTPIDRRKEQKKYYIKVFKNADDSYLHITVGGIYSKPELDTIDSKSFVTVSRIAFSNEQIEQLKQRDDIAIDWNKVTLEEAN